jgi:hypothetical protein
MDILKKLNTKGHVNTDLLYNEFSNELLYLCKFIIEYRLISIHVGRSATEFASRTSSYFIYDKKSGQYILLLLLRDLFSNKEENVFKILIKYVTEVEF